MTTGQRSVSSPALPDYREGIKKEVAEIKFLIHDLRVEGFLNEILHYHVTLNTDLEIYNIAQAQVLHGADVQELKVKLGVMRKALQDYSNAVKSFSPDRTVLLLGRRYIETIRDVCDLILNPLWGRSDKVLSFLPDEARSVRWRRRYRNCISWLYGVHLRIEAFLEEQEKPGVREEFDIAEDVRDFTRDVVMGYVVEKSEARVELQLDRLDSAVIVGNRPRFRRMYFNLVMNAVDAMSGRKAGVLNVSASIEGERVALRVRDDGVGMTPEKIQQLLSDRPTLDGELHSLGFVFVRQTVAEFGGDLSIESTVGKGTTMTLRLPYLPGKTAAELDPSRQDKYRLPPRYRSFPAEGDPLEAAIRSTTIADVDARRPVAPKEAPADGVTGLGKRRPAAPVRQARLRGLPEVPGSVPGQHLRHRRYRGRQGRDVHGQALRARLEHLARGPLAHALPGDLSRTHRGGRAEEAHPDPQAAPEASAITSSSRRCPRQTAGPSASSAWSATSASGSPASSSRRDSTRRSRSTWPARPSSSPLPRSCSGPSRSRSTCWHARGCPRKRR